MPASQEDIEGLRTADVRRVEYLEFPTDPRFRGAQHVINIIIQEYEYGGYTKITANENFLVGLSSRTNIFTKFAYKKMTYDLYVAANNWDNHHAGYDVEGQYSLTDNQGKDYTLRFLSALHTILIKYKSKIPSVTATRHIPCRNKAGRLYILRQKEMIILSTATIPPAAILSVITARLFSRCLKTFLSTLHLSFYIHTTSIRLHILHHQPNRLSAMHAKMLIIIV